MKHIFIVSYGGGHARMLVPVARMLLNKNFRVTVLGLTTGLATYRSQGVDALALSDVVSLLDNHDEIMAVGARLVQGRIRHASVSYIDTCAYYGLGFLDLVKCYGPDEARKLFHENDRKAFDPVSSCEKILRKLSPDLVLTTNSPRMERAMVRAAKNIGMPCVVLVDSVATVESQWLADSFYGDRLCVFHKKVKSLLVARGRCERDIEVTGNPAFDQLREISSLNEIYRPIPHVLYLAQSEDSLLGPTDGSTSDTTVIRMSLEQLGKAVDQGVCTGEVRMHPNFSCSNLLVPKNLLVSNKDDSFESRLARADIILTASSTGGFQALAVGKMVLQVGWSVRSNLFRFSDFGRSVFVKDPANLVAVIKSASRDVDEASSFPPLGVATERVVGCAAELLSLQ